MKISKFGVKTVELNKFKLFLFLVIWKDFTPRLSNAFKQPYKFQKME
ncbi:hypothetical protein N752_24400 [Desulforamulus aquiferis]|nr:hypothetical protein N752_24400 [Desulforamulus aquiferis]